MKLRNPASNSHGFSLIELMIVVGILSVVAVGTSLQLIGTYRDSLRMQSKANMIQTKGLVGKMFNRSSANNARACKDILVPVGNFNPSGETEVEIRLSDTEPAMAAGTKVSGASQFEIQRMYLADAVDLSPQRPNSFLVNLYMSAKVGPMSELTQMKTRPVGTVVVTLNGVGGKFKECNVNTSTMTPNETCEAMYGMTWNPQTGECDQALTLDTDYNLTSCPPGTQKISGVCIPTPSGCGYGQIARGFDLGLTQNCTEPPLNPAIGIPTLPVPPPVEGVANQTPQQVNPGTALPPVTSATIAPKSPASPPPPAAACEEGIGSVNYDRCAALSTCVEEIDGLPEATNAQCVVASGTPYSTLAPASTPSPAPPPDFSCACNNARIPNGEYCAYCVPKADFGFGYVDYAYGVNRCVNGNLVPDNAATGSFDPRLECSGGYAPINRSGPKFRQLDGYDLR